MTFTTGNWATAQTLTITSPDEGDSSNDTATINLTSSSATATSVSAAQQDNDLLDLTVDGLATNTVQQCPNGIGPPLTVTLLDDSLSGPLVVTITKISGPSQFMMSPTSITLDFAGSFANVDASVGFSTSGTAQFVATAPNQTARNFSLLAHNNNFCML
jgi:hypothetical protein